MFQINEKNGVKYLTISEFQDTGLVRHCFSTRAGGVSTGEAAGLNLGFARKDTRENVLRNFQLLCDAIQVPAERLVLTDQVHGCSVRAATEEDAGKGIVRASDIRGVDALVTNVPNLPLCTFHADCIPLFLLDPVRRAIGLAHSGWKGTYLNIAKNTVETMQKQYGTNPADLLCGVGPSIGVCHFEVDEALAQEFSQKYGGRFIVQKQKPHVDLTAIVHQQLQDCGVQKVIQSGICTFCSKDLFYSYRGDRHRTGSLASVMMLVG